LLAMIYFAVTLATQSGLNEEKVQFIQDAGRRDPSISGLLMQADLAFQLRCGRALTLPELSSVHGSPQFERLTREKTVGISKLQTVLTPSFSTFSCNKKGAS